MGDSPAWRSLLRMRVEQRDQAEAAFGGVFAKYNTLSIQASQLAHENTVLRQQLLHHQDQHAAVVKQLDAANEFGSPEAQQRLKNLQTEVQQLKSEQADLYKTQGQNAQRLVEMVEAIKQHEDTIKKQNDEIQKMAAYGNALQTKLKDALELIKEKDGVIQILKDELATHQLELVQREEELRTVTAHSKKLEVENRELVDRWISHKQKEAAKMNEANEFVENALKTKQVLFSRRQSEMEFGKEQVPEKVGVQSILPTVAVKKLSVHDGDINCIQINRDGSLISTGGSDKKVILYDARSGAIKATLSGSLQSIMSCAFSVDGELILGTSNDNSVKIWSISTCRLKHTLTGHIGKVYSAKFTDSNRVISGSHDRTLKLWDLGKGFCMKTIFTLSSCNDLELLDGEGTVIVSGHLDNNMRLWDTRTGNMIREISGIHSSQITSVNLSPHQNHILTTSRDNSLKLIDTRTFETVATYYHDNFRVGMNWSKSCFSPDAAFIASGSLDGTVYIWNALTANVEVMLKDQHRSSVCGVVWNPQGGSRVYSAEKERGVVLWGSSK